MGSSLIDQILDDFNLFVQAAMIEGSKGKIPGSDVVTSPKVAGIIENEAIRILQKHKKDFGENQLQEALQKVIFEVMK